MRYALAYLNHNSGAWSYKLIAIDIPVYDKSYFDIADHYVPILCRIIRPGVLQDILTGEKIVSTITNDNDYEIGMLSCEGYLEVSGEFVLKMLKQNRDYFQSYLSRMESIKSDVLEHHQARGK